MPIKIPDSLPATATLESENIFVMTEYRAIHQDIRPLKLLILNLMPTKIVTETQLLRKLSNSPLQVQVELLHTLSHVSQNTDAEHLSSFYTSFDQIKDRNYDGMIITGAPVENLDFTDVDYWDELCQIMDWTTTHVHSTLHICWGAQAGLYYHYGIPKYNLGKKLFGVFPHTMVRPQSPLFRGFDDIFYVPHSRYTENKLEDIQKVPELELLAVSEQAGVFAVKSFAVVAVLERCGKQFDGHCVAISFISAQSFADSSKSCQSCCAVTDHLKGSACVTFNRLAVKADDRTRKNVFFDSFVIFDLTILSNGSRAVNEEIKGLICRDTDGQRVCTEHTFNTKGGSYRRTRIRTCNTDAAFF